VSDTAYTHVGFADESNCSQGRFRSISLVTATVDDARAFHQDLDGLRQSHGRTEYKWKGAERRQGIALGDFFFARRPPPCVLRLGEAPAAKADCSRPGGRAGSSIRRSALRGPVLGS